ncbi:MAG TPA: hypothetical protein VK066_08545 [Chloroflexota bacterium]|nr:hypothetical protein [Chloroflexota bacterium]
MRLDPTASEAQMLAALRRDAEATWGAERLPALGPALEALASALWELSRRPFEVEAEEPDYVQGSA